LARPGPRALRPLEIKLQRPDALGVGRDQLPPVVADFVVPRGKTAAPQLRDLLPVPEEVLPRRGRRRATSPAEPLRRQVSRGLGISDRCKDRQDAVNEGGTHGQNGAKEQEPRTHGNLRESGWPPRASWGRAGSATRLNPTKGPGWQSLRPARRS